jgi:hypothetical protein
MAASIGMLGHASSASAKEFIADAVPLEVVVQSAAQQFGLPVRICSNGKRPVTGRFNFREASASGWAFQHPAAGPLAGI